MNVVEIKNRILDGAANIRISRIRLIIDKTRREYETKMRNYEIAIKMELEKLELNKRINMENFEIKNKKSITKDLIIIAYIEHYLTNGKISPKDRVSIASKVGGTLYDRRTCLDIYTSALDELSVIASTCNEFISDEEITLGLGITRCFDEFRSLVTINKSEAKDYLVGKALYMIDRPFNQVQTLDQDEIAEAKIICSIIDRYSPQTTNDLWNEVERSGIKIEHNFEHIKGCQCVDCGPDSEVKMICPVDSMLRPINIKAVLE